MRELLASWDSIPPVDMTYDLRTEGVFEAQRAALASLLSQHARMMLIIGPAPFGAQYVEMVLSEEELTKAIRDYALRAFAFSLFISGVTAALLYFILSRFFVRPLQALSDNMATFPRTPGKSRQRHPADRPRRRNRRGRAILARNAKRHCKRR